MDCTDFLYYEKKMLISHVTLIILESSSCNSKTCMAKMPLWKDFLRRFTVVTPGYGEKVLYVGSMWEIAGGQLVWQR